MSDVKKYSLPIRIICGFLGVSVFSALLYNFLTVEGVVFEFKQLASVFAGFIFIYVAIVGTNPLDKLSEHRR
jgi:hypothetical protein